MMWLIYSLVAEGVTGTAAQETMASDGCSVVFGVIFGVDG
jgi:hypothetical protein